MNPRVLLAVVVGVIGIAPMVAPAFYVTLLNYIGLYSLVALGLVLLTGVAGQTSFGQAAFVGLGAYTTAVLTTQYGMSPWLTLAIAPAITLAVGYLLGIITLSMGGHYLPLATIDGETARDFDDAVWAEKQGKGWRLVVAIADVSHYVRPGMALDKEALSRGNSVYFPRRVIPMLPEKGRAHILD